MNIIEKQWELQKKKFEFMESDLVEKIENAYKTLKENDFTGVFLFEDEVYHNGIGVAKRQLDKIRKSPRRFYYDNYIAPDMTRTDPMKIGSLVHTAILEPGYLSKRFVSSKAMVDKIIEMRPDIKNPTATKEYKEAKKIIEEQGITVLSEDVFNMAKEMTESVFKHEKLQNILKNGLAERCVYSIDPDTGLLVRCKPDYMLLDSGINFDLKTTIDASPEEFGKSIWNYRYFVQAAYYNHICTLACQVEFKQFLFGCLEKTAPYDIAIYYASQDVLAHGRAIMMEDLRTYKGCLESGIWHGYPRTINPIDMPAWAYYKGE